MDALLLIFHSNFFASLTYVPSTDCGDSCTGTTTAAAAAAAAAAATATAFSDDDRDDDGGASSSSDVVSKTKKKNAPPPAAAASICCRDPTQGSGACFAVGDCSEIPAGGTTGVNTSFHVTRIDLANATNASSSSSSALPFITSPAFDCSEWSESGIGCTVIDYVIGGSGQTFVQLLLGTDYHVFEYEHNASSVRIRQRCRYPWTNDCTNYPDECVTWTRLAYDAITDSLYGTAEQRISGTSVMFSIDMPADNDDSCVFSSVLGDGSVAAQMPIPLVYPQRLAFDTSRNALFYGVDAGTDINFVFPLSLDTFSIGDTTPFRIQGHQLDVTGDSQSLLAGSYNCYGGDSRCLLKFGILENGTLIEEGNTVRFPAVDNPPFGLLYAVSASPSRTIAAYGFWTDYTGGWSGTIDVMDVSCDNCTGVPVVTRQTMPGGCAFAVPSESCSVGGWLLVDGASS